MSLDLRVRNIPKNASDKQLKDYFEKARIFGFGVRVTNIKNEGEEAIVTFDDEAGMNRVLKKHAEERCIFLRCPLDIEQVMVSSHSQRLGQQTVSQSDHGSEEDIDTVEVHGIDGTVSEELLLNYFENPFKAGGGEITHIQVLDDSAQIKFKDKTVVGHVCKRSHMLAGQSLKVKPLIMSKQALLVMGLPPEVTKEMLVNYIEAKLHVPTVSASFSADRSRAVVEFTKDIDAEEAELIFSRYPFMKAHVHVQAVPVSSSLLVSNLPESVSNEAVGLYFENTNKSGGGPVDSVDMEDGAGYCVVHFQNSKDMKSACEKSSQMLSGVLLSVTPYHRCLGQPKSVAETKLVIPTAIDLDPEDSLKLRIPARKPSKKESISAKLANVYAKINDWEEEKLRIVCTLTDSVDSWQSKAKSWETDVKQAIQEYLELEVKKCNVSREAWDIATTGLGNLIVTDPDRTFMLHEKDSDSVILVAQPEQVGLIWDQIEKIITDAEQKIRRKCETVSKDIILTAPWQLKYLKAANFKDKIQNQMKDISVHVDGEKIKFKGSHKDVTEAVLAHYKLLGDKKSSILDIPAEQVQLLKKDKVMSFVEQSIQEKGVVGAIEVVSNTATVHGEDGACIQKIERIVAGLLVSVPVPLNKDNMPVVQTSKWHRFVDGLTQQHNGCVQIQVSQETKKLQIHTLADIKQDITHTLQEFLKTNTVLSDRVVFQDGEVVKYMEAFLKGEMEKGIKRCESKPKYRIEGACLTISGTQDDVRVLKKHFQDLGNRVQKLEFHLNVIGVQKYFSCPDGRQCVSHLETAKNCLVVVSDGQGHGRASRGSRGSPLGARCSLVNLQGKIKVRTECGDLTRQTVDVIVVVGSRNLHFSSRLHQLIAERGGRSIEEECKRKSDDGSLQEGEVYLSSGGRLGCHAIAHVVLTDWNKAGHSTGILEQCVEGCLQESDKRGFRSIAFPGLGTGQLHYPTDATCQAIISCLQHYTQQTPDTGLMEVVFCDRNQEIVAAFERCLAKTFGQQDEARFEEERENRHVRGGAHRPMSRSESQGSSSGSPSAPRGVRIGCTYIKVVPGLLAEQNVDVIVDSAPSDLSLKKGRCSNALLVAGGWQIQQACKDHYPDGIRPGQVAVTTGGKLTCQKLFHITLQTYNQEQKQSALQGFRKSIRKCLKEASNRDYETIAIPSAGTGSLKYPSRVVAAEMFACVAEFLRDNPRTSLSMVRFVIFPEDQETVMAFQNEESKLSGHRPRTQPSDDVEVVYQRDGRGGHDNRDQTIEIDCHSAKILVVKGHLTKEKVDVIVNSTSRDLQLEKGQSSKAILTAAGGIIQQECLQLYPKGIEAGKVAITSPGNLSCKKLFHVALPPFQAESGEESMQGLTASIEQCLAEADKQQFQTISMPPMGVGALKYPKSWVAGKTLSCITKYFQANQRSSLRKVRLVIFPRDDDVYQAFRKEAVKRTGQSHTESDKNRKEAKDALKSFMSKEKNMCLVTLFADSNRSLQEAKHSLEATVKKEWCMRKIEDETISTLGHQQVKQIKDEFKKCNIFAHINPLAGCIIAYGQPKDMVTVSDKLDDVLRNQQRYLAKKREAGLVKNVIRWSFIVDNKARPFSDMDNLHIEQAFKKKDKQIQVKNRSGQTFTIDLQKMHSYENSNPGTQFSVIRRNVMEDTSGTVPSNWTKTSASDNVTLVPLAQGSAEYTKVLNDFQKTLFRAPNIIKIERVQNKTLYIQYAAKLQSINTQNGNTNNVTMLWHGTSADIVPSIYTHGFNRSYCGTCSIGKGVYFAVNAQYSDGGYARPDNQGHKRMFRCLVITGQTTQGRGGMITPPQRTTLGSTPILYDSVTDNPNGPSMFVIFHDCQAYPEHLITYT